MYKHKQSFQTIFLCFYFRNSWNKYLQKLAFFVHRQMAADQNHLAREDKLDTKGYFDGPGDIKSLCAANNIFHIEYSYVSSSIKDCRTMDFYMKVHPCDLQFGEEANAKELLEILSQIMKNTEWPEELCKGKHLQNAICRKPNVDKIPDIVLYMHCTEAHVRDVPMFICDIIGSKEIWGTGKMQYPGYVSTLKFLLSFL